MIYNNIMAQIRIRDFFEIENKIYAVISNEPFAGYLRYVRFNNVLKKVPGEIFIPENFNFKFYSARERAREIYQKNFNELDEFEKKIYKLIDLFSKKINEIGVTGSALLKCYNENSDIDICFYNYKDFELARKIIKKELEKENNTKIIKNLNEEQFAALYKKRIYNNELNFDEFVWHEKRKFNKGIIDNTRFDILLCEWTKIDFSLKFDKNIKIMGKVIDEKSFSFPTYFKVEDINDRKIYEIFSYTHTYTGQAFKNEYVEVCGKKEKEKNLILIGSDRKAINEYIKVIA